MKSRGKERWFDIAGDVSSIVSVDVSWGGAAIVIAGSCCACATISAAFCMAFKCELHAMCPDTKPLGKPEGTAKPLGRLRHVVVHQHRDDGGGGHGSVGAHGGDRWR